MMHISIPKPCYEDWNEMTPNEQGRHCNACCKTVVDFTCMNDEEVKYFFLNKKKEETVCGRFRSEQIQRIKIELPYNIYKLSMPFWKRFLTACLLAFSSMLFSCDALVGKTEIKGEFVVPQINPPAYSATVSPSIMIDCTTKTSCTALMGDTVITTQTITQGFTVIAPVEPERELPVIEPTITDVDTPRTVITGKVAFDTGIFINPNAIDTAKPVKKQSDCGNDFINL